VQRNTNAILEQARAKLDSANEIAKLELRKAELKFREAPSDHTHGKLQFWESKQAYNRFCLGDKNALGDIQKAQVDIAKLVAMEETEDIAKKLLVLYELRNTATAHWKESRVFPIVSVGGKDEGRWMNKTIFFQEKKGDLTQLEFVIIWLSRSLMLRVIGGPKPQPVAMPLHKRRGYVSQLISKVPGPGMEESGSSQDGAARQTESPLLGRLEGYPGQEECLDLHAAAT